MPPPHRLTHTSNKAFLRFMQMSTASVFAFVEGQTDRYFYDKLCSKVFPTRGINHEICLIQELPSGAGGKQALIKFFNYLKRNSSLLNDFKGKKTISIFFLDKDVDELIKKYNETEHIIYTEHYCLENYLYIHGDVNETLAATASLEVAKVQKRLGPDNLAWRQKIAESWKDWIKLCIYSQKHRIRFDCNYGSCSRINPKPYEPVDEPSYIHRLANIEIRSGLTPIGFKRSLTWTSKLVDQIYTRNEFDRIFKGKWYADFLLRDAEILAGGRAYESNNLARRLVAGITLTLDFNDPWTQYFTNQMSKLADKL